MKLTGVSIDASLKNPHDGFGRNMNYSKEVKSALLWVTSLLKKHAIPFQISGGLAANVYGGVRPIIDIDIDIPNEAFSFLEKEVEKFIIFGPKRYKSDKWDLYLMTLHYAGLEIDLSGISDVRIFDEKINSWVVLSGSLSLAVVENVLGLRLPVIPKDQLISYKKILSRPEDLIDINEITRSRQ